MSMACLAKKQDGENYLKYTPGMQELTFMQPWQSTIVQLPKLSSNLQIFNSICDSKRIYRKQDEGTNY